MIDLAPQVMLLADSNGSILRANKALLNLISSDSFNAVLGSRFQDVFRFSDPHKIAPLLNPAEGHTSFEAHALLPDRTEGRFRFTAVRSSGPQSLTVIIAEDITGETEKAVTAETRHRTDAVRALGGALMHNVNQPLTVILLRAHLLQLDVEKGSASPSQISESLGDIVGLTQQIAGIIRSAAQTRDFVTVPYADGTDILDLNRSSPSSDGLPDTSPLTLFNILLGALDTHEPGAMLHAQNTAMYASRISRELEMEFHQASTIERGAFFHDIGKLGVPDYILRKAGDLTDGETEVMRTHALLGSRLLGAFPSLSNESAVANCHHERFDGRGYPRGLKANEIPLGARIAAVADAYDVLNSGRSYKSAVDASSAMAEIASNSGSQFDPRVVEAFQRVTA
ncbi:MAG: HD domain-containing phosphohydrolase [Kiritimatiellia bacterium]